MEVAFLFLALLFGKLAVKYEVEEEREHLPEWGDGWTLEENLESDFGMTPLEPVNQ